MRRCTKYKFTNSRSNAQKVARRDGVLHGRSSGECALTGMATIVAPPLVMVTRETNVDEGLA